MLIQQKIGHIGSFEIKDRLIDHLKIEWYETGKRILTKQTESGKEVSLKFLDERPNLSDGDILYESDDCLIVVSINICTCINIFPANIIEAAAVSYEIGNRHVALFIEGESLLVPYDAPIFNWLQAQGFNIKLEEKKLLHPFKTTIAPHSISIGNDVFSKLKA